MNRRRPTTPRASRPKPRPLPSMLPHECIVLAVDTAQVSGWCISVRGVYISSGEHDMLRHPQHAEGVCRAALEVARCNVGTHGTAILVYERPFEGTAQGQYIGAWKTAWAAAGGVKSRTLGVYPSTWRARVLGPGWARARRDDVRPFELQVAKRVTGRVLGGDEAAAVCIAQWASRAGEVLAKLPAGVRSKAKETGT